MKTIRWVLAHEPIELFLRAAKRFKATMEKTAPGRLNYEILTLSEYADKYKNGAKITKHDLLQLMEDGDIEMSQMYTSTLGRKHHRDMWALDMPFLFRRSRSRKDRVRRRNRSNSSRWIKREDKCSRSGIYL